MKSIIFLIILIFSLQSFSQNFPVGDKVLNEIHDTFYENGQLSVKKIEDYKKSLLKRSDEVRKNIINYKHLHDGKGTKKSIKAANKNKFVKSIKMLINDWIDKIDFNLDPVAQIEYLSNIIDLNNAILIEITPYLSEVEMINMIGAIIKNVKIDKTKVSRHGEAHNLINPANGTYFSQEELKELKMNGVDISKFDPPQDNGVIELMDDISKASPHSRYRLGMNALHKGFMGGFPAENIGFFKELRKTQTRPKIIFETKDSEGNVTGEFKIKMGMEIHSEPTTGALGTTLGLFHDLSKHVNDFKIYFGDKTWDEFVLDFSSYFEYEDLEIIVKEHGVDPVHGTYIVFNQGLLEAKFKKKNVQRVGPFYPGLKKGKRETRALLLFNMWVHNIDLKPGENNKTIIRHDETGDKLFYLQHDIGFSIGKLGREKPTDFEWNLVKRVNRKKIIFDFKTFIPHHEIDQITYSDAKWMARKIAQLTRKQITEAVSFGQWPNQSPYNYHQLIIEKLISRRNDLVKAFKLDGEVLANGKTILLLEVNRAITKDAIPTRKYLDGYTVNFKPAVKYDYIIPGLKSLWEAIVDGVASGTAGIDRIRLNPSWVGLDIPWAKAEVLLGTNRQIIKNPEPQSESDRYIVKEDFRIGGRAGAGVGAGLILSGDVALVKQYSLLYTVSNPEHASNHGKWLFDFTLPYRINKLRLPKKHIIIKETLLESGPSLRLQTPMSGGGVEGRANLVKLNRTIIGNKNNGVVKLLEDKANFNDNSIEFYSKLLVINFRHLVAGSQHGKIKRKIYEVSNVDGGPSSDAIDAVLMRNDYSQIKKLGESSQVESKFRSDYRTFDFLGFVTSTRSYRGDDIYIFQYDKNGKRISTVHQLEGTYRKKNSWKILVNGEDRIARVTMSTKVDEDKNLIDPYISFNFEHVDLNTTAKEIDNGYIPFFNGVADDEKFIEFTAQNQSITKFYGDIRFHLRLQYYKEGIEKLLSISKEEFYTKLSEVTKIDRAVLLREKRKENRKFSFQGVSYRVGKIRRIAKRVYRLISHAQTKAKGKIKVRRLVKALIEAIPRKGQSQNPILLTTLNRIVGDENLYMDAEIESPSYQENKMPGRITPFNAKGVKRPYGDRELQVLGVQDALMIYNQF